MKKRKLSLWLTLGCRKLHIEENHSPLKVVHRAEKPVQKVEQAFFFSPEKTRAGEYRYGFNGMEKDDEVAGEGNSYTTNWRQYDPRIARWKSVEPKAKLIPFESTYSFSHNMPIYGSDPDGDFCVPCVIILIGLLTAPSVAHNKTGDYESDINAINQAEELKNNWIKNSILSGGVITGAVPMSALGQEFVMNASVNLIRELTSQQINGTELNLGSVVTDAISDLDVFDAYLSSTNMNEILELILSSSIDITPEEADLIGFTKPLSEATLDAVMQALLNKLLADSNSKIDSWEIGSISKPLKRFLKKFNEAAQKATQITVEEFLKHPENRIIEDVKEDNSTIQDNLQPENYLKIYEEIEIPEFKNEDEKNGG